MDSYTIEYQRFGDPVGMIRLSDRYIRTLGPTAPAEEVGVGISQENLDRGIAALGYDLFRRHRDIAEGVRRTAEAFLEDISKIVRSFSIEELENRIKDSGLTQIDIVTSALELAQLPFEVLEESHPNLVVTRRIRQPWPAPEVVHRNVPRVLFVWAEPGSMKVPHDLHEQILKELLQEVGADPSACLVEVPNATTAKIRNALVRAEEDDKPFTHVHLLVHGRRPKTTQWEPGDRIDLSPSRPEPAVYLALEEADGEVALCPPAKLAALFEPHPRPETFAIATCHSGEIDPIRSGGTLAHVMHAAGVPVVLASQLALTKEGSGELLKTFFSGVIRGKDPRKALRECRDALREAREQTFYDRVALVGYIHLDEEWDERLTTRQFEVALARLGAISRQVNARVKPVIDELQKTKELTGEQREEAKRIRSGFAEVREGLAARERKGGLSKAQLEELRGLQASSLKREAEAAWKLCSALTGSDRDEWVTLSHEALVKAAEAYRHAARTSRDHHWSWVQWLALQAVIDGTLESHADAWVTAKEAANDAVEAGRPPYATPTPVPEEAARQAVWSLGSLTELYLLAPLALRDLGGEAEAYLRQLVAATRKLHWEYSPIDATLAQLNRYGTWWGVDPHWQLPTAVVDRARELHECLTRLLNNE